MANEKLKQALELLQEVGEAVLSESPAGPMQVQTTDAYVLTMYARARSHFQAVRLLIEQDLLDEALILTRTLFLECLRLGELERVGEGRVALILDWAERSVKQKEDFVRELHQLGAGSNYLALLPGLEEERGKLLSYAERHGITERRRFGGVEKLAQRLNRQEDYIAYRFADELAKGSKLAYDFRTNKLDKDTIGVFLKNPNPQLSIDTIIFSVRSMLLAHQAASKILKWPESRRIGSLVSEVEQLARIRNQESEGPDSAVVRFGVRSANTRSAVWRVWCGKSHPDLYIAAEPIAGAFKASLHQSGKWRVAFTEQHAKGANSLLQPGRDRAIRKWERPAEIYPGVTQAFEVLIPASEVTSPREENDTNDQVVWLTVPAEGTATRFIVALVAPGTPVSSWPGRNTGSRFVGKITLVDGSTAFVVAQDLSVTAELRAQIDKLRSVRATRTSTGERITGLRGVGIMERDDETCSFLDFAIPDQEVSDSPTQGESE